MMSYKVLSDYDRFPVVMSYTDLTRTGSLSDVLYIRFCLTITGSISDVL